MGERSKRQKTKKEISGLMLAFLRYDIKCGRNNGDRTAFYLSVVELTIDVDLTLSNVASKIRNGMRDV